MEAKQKEREALMSSRQARNKLKTIKTLLSALIL